MSYRILIIDDDADIRWMLRSLLESHGYHCEEAPNAITALTMIQDGKFDLILTDYQMPRMNGLELLQRLSTLPEGSTIPVIMLSAIDDDALTVKAKQAGAKAILKKPIDFDEFLLTVTRSITQSRTCDSDPCHCI